MFLIYLMFTQGSDLLEKLLLFCTWWWPDPGPLFKQTWIFRMRGCCHILLILMVVLTFSKPSDCCPLFFSTLDCFIFSTILLFYYFTWIFNSIKNFISKKYITCITCITLLVEITKLQNLNNWKYILFSYYMFKTIILRYINFQPYIYL